jgi:hypothetical protein
MTRTLPLVLLLINSHAFSQCHYPVTLSTNKDYCVGSSLVVTSPHSMEKIIWYKDGQPVDPVKAEQSLATTPISIDMPGCFLLNGALAVDEAGNIYTYDEYGTRIIRRSAIGGGITTIAPFQDAQDLRLFVDRSENVYASLAQTWQAVKIAPGSQDPIVVATLPPVSGIGGTTVIGLYVDCQGTIFEPIAEDMFV